MRAKAGPRCNHAISRIAHKSIESLESRFHLSLSAGPEIAVNTFTTGSQALPAIAVDGDGDFVVVWETEGEGAAGVNDIFARRYNSSGVAQGVPFRVNSYTTNNQHRPAIASDADGDFIVAWESQGQDGSLDGIYSRRFDAAGNALGTEFRVNAYTTNNQWDPAVATDPAGNFVITFASQHADGSNFEVYASRYNHLGVLQGVEFKVNTYTTNTQNWSTVAMDGSGDFVVVWQSAREAAGGFGIYGQRFNSSGVTQGGEFGINTYTFNNQVVPSVAIDHSGNFVVAWQSYDQDAEELYGFYARRFNASGAPLTGETIVHLPSSSGSIGPTVAMDANGDYVIVWSSETDGSGHGSFYQRYTAAGAFDGGGQINVHTTNGQFQPAVGMAGDRDFVVAWQSTNQEGAGSSGGIYARRFTESIDSGAPVVAGAFAGGSRILPYQVYGAPMGQLIVSASEVMSDSGGTGGVNSITNPANWLLTLNGADQSSNISSISFGFNLVTNRYEATIQLTTPIQSGNVLLMVKENVRDTSGNQLDGNFDGSALGNHILPFSIAAVGPLGGDVRANTYTTLSQNAPSVDMDSSGNFVVVWNGAGIDDSEGIFAQRFNSSGTPVGSEFRVNTYTTGVQSDAQVVMEPDGDFVVGWAARGQPGQVGPYPDVFLKRYNAAGVQQGSEFMVNVYTTNVQQSPSMAIDGSGNVWVTWTATLGASGQGHYLRRFNASNVALTGDILIKGLTGGQPSIAVNAAGSGVVAWDANGSDGNGVGISARRVDSSGTPVGLEFQVNTYTTNGQFTPSVGMDSAGNFVIAWSSDGQDGSNTGIYAQRFDSAGAAIGNEFQAHTYTASSQVLPDVGMRADGSFVIVWQSEGPDGSGQGIVARSFNAAGTPLGPEVVTNVYTTVSQGEPAVTINDNGIVVSWRSDMQDSGTTGVYFRQYGSEVSLSTPPLAGLLATPDPVVAGNSFTLSATSTNGPGILSSVSFYQESNNLPGLQVGFQGDTFVATDSTETSGIWSINVSTASMALGQHTYYAQALSTAGLTGAPASTTSTVTLTVLASQFSFQSAPQKLMFTFDGDASGMLSVGNILLERIGGGGVPVLTMLPFGTDGANVASFTMNTQLADGNYRATVQGIEGANVLNFFILGGDANHDRKVDARDLLILANNWFGAGKTWSQGDFNYDGVVNQTDLTVMAQRWQQNLAAPPPEAAIPTGARAPTRAPVRTPNRAIDLVQ